MGTLKVDNLQKRDGTALITDGAATSSLLSASALKTVGLPVLLETTTASSSSSVEFTNMNTRGYLIYRIEAVGVLPGTDNAKLSLRVAGADGTIDTGSIYNYACKGLTSTGSDTDNGNQTQTLYRIFSDTIETGSETDEGCNFTMHCYNLADSVKFSQFRNSYTTVGSNYVVTGDSACNVYEAGHVTTKINFFFSSGTVAAGTFKLYGIA